MKMIKMHDLIDLAIWLRYIIGIIKSKYESLAIV